MVRKNMSIQKKLNSTGEVTFTPDRTPAHIQYSQLYHYKLQKKFHDHISSCSTSTAVQSTAIKVHELYVVVILCDIQILIDLIQTRFLLAWPSWSSVLTLGIQQNCCQQSRPFLALSIKIPTIKKQRHRRFLRRNQIHRSERWISKEPW